MCWSQLSAFKQTILDVALFTNSSCIFLEEKIKHTNSPLYRQENSMISSHTTAVKPQYNRTFNFLLLKSVNFLIAYLELIYFFFFLIFHQSCFFRATLIMLMLNSLQVFFEENAVTKCFGEKPWHLAGGLGDGVNDIPFFLAATGTLSSSNLAIAFNSHRYNSLKRYAFFPARLPQKHSFFFRLKRIQPLSAWAINGKIQKRNAY